MNKVYFQLLMLTTLVSCFNGNKDSVENSSDSETTPKDELVIEKIGVDNDSDGLDTSKLSLYKKYELFELTDTIKACFVDNNDTLSAYFVGLNGMSGIKFLNRKGEIIQSIGDGDPFPGIGDDLSWVDKWGIVYDKETYETEIVDGEITGELKVALERPSVLLISNDLGGGLISYVDGAFKWIHQTD